MKNKIISYKFSIILIIIFIINNYFLNFSIINIKPEFLNKPELFNNKVINVYNIILTFYLTFIAISVWLFWVIVSMKETIIKINIINPKAVKKIINKFKFYLIFLSIISILLFSNYILFIFSDYISNNILSNNILNNILPITLLFIVFLLETVYSIFHIFMAILNKFIKDK